MSQDRWRRIETIFNEARTQPVSERAAFVAKASDGDVSLQQEILSLLGHSSSPTFFDGTSSDVPEIIDEKSLIGRRVGNYDVTDILGLGGMGCVYRARDTRLGRDVALKFVTHAFTDPNGLARFDREARALASLNHAHIGAIYGLEEIDGKRALVLELLEGPTLASRLAQGPMPLDDVRRYGAQIADALAEAHAAGIVHRDLKPGNVMLTRHGVKVVDFGLAKMEQFADLAITHGNMVFGTPAYMAPEQIEGKAVGPASDLFALGLILYEMVTGQLPVPGASIGALLRGGAVTIRPPSQISSKTPAALDTLIVGLLQKNPEERPASAALVRDTLAESVALESPARRLLVAAAVTGIPLAIAAGAWWTLGRERPNTLRPTRLTPIALFPGDKQDPSFSPDGSTIAFSWAGVEGGRPGIYALATSGGEPRQVTNSPTRDISPAWAPDGQEIAFLRERPGGASELFIVPASGGPARKVRDIRMPEILRRNNRPLLTWTPDARGLVVPSEDPETGGVSLFRVGLDDGERRSLIGARGGFFLNPSFSRDGRLLAYYGLVPPSGLDVQRVNADGTPTGAGVDRVASVLARSPAWSPDGRELLFVSGSQVLAWDARTHVVSLVYASPYSIQAMSVSSPSPGVLQAALSIDSNQAEMRSVSIEDSGRRLADVPGTFLHLGAAPAFSLDGRWIVFDGGPNPLSMAEIWMTDVRGERARPLTPPGFSRASWSFDGRHVAFFGGPNSQIYVLDVDPGKEIFRSERDGPTSVPRQVTHAAFGLISPDWSADGRYLYVTRPGPTYRVMRVATAGGEVEDLFEGGFKQLDPSARKIYYGKADQPGIFVRSLDGDTRSNPEERLVSDYVPPRGFDVSSSGIFYVGRDADGKPVAIRFFDFAARKSFDLAPAPNGTIPSIAISPDGRRLLYDTKVDAAGGLTLMQLGRTAN